MPSSVYDFDAIAEVLRRGKPKAQDETPVDVSIKIRFVNHVQTPAMWCQICGTGGWKFTGNGQYVVCPLCQNPNGKPNPSRSTP
jgi:rubrerythrin